MVSILSRIKNRVRRSILLHPHAQKYFQSQFFTRFIVKKQSEQLFDLVAGFVYSQILYSCVTLKIFENLKSKPLKSSELEKKCGLNTESFDCLISAAVSLGLLQRLDEGMIELRTKGFVIAMNPGLCELILHHKILYRDMQNPVGLLADHGKETELSKYWPYATKKNEGSFGKMESIGQYSDLMSISQPLVTDQIFSAHSFSKYKKVLDLGGGQATFSIKLATAYRHLNITCFDLTAVSELAKKNIKAKGLGNQISFQGGNFFNDALPSGYDLITLIRVLYDHPDEKVSLLLSSIKKCMPPGGALLIAEPMITDPQSEPIRKSDAYFYFYLLAMGKGKPRSLAGITKLLYSAGFSKIRKLSCPLPSQAGILLAK